MLADDISDFQIEGMSIGDSALDYISEEEIERQVKITSTHYLHLSNPYKFSEVYISNKNFKTYETVSILFKSKDKNFIIFAIRGMIAYIEDLDGCQKKQKEVVREIKKILTEVERFDGEVESPQDHSGESKYYGTQFYFTNGDDIQILCNNWNEELRKKNNWTEGLNIIVAKNEFNRWNHGK